MNKKPLIGITTSYDREHKEMNIRTTYTEAVMHGGGIPVLLPVTMEPERNRELFDSQHLWRADQVLLRPREPRERRVRTGTGAPRH